MPAKPKKFVFISFLLLEKRLKSIVCLNLKLNYLKLLVLHPHWLQNQLSKTMRTRFVLLSFKHLQNILKIMIFRFTKADQPNKYLTDDDPFASGP